MPSLAVDNIILDDEESHDRERAVDLDDDEDDDGSRSYSSHGVGSQGEEGSLLDRSGGSVVGSYHGRGEGNSVDSSSYLNDNDSYSRSDDGSGSGSYDSREEDSRERSMDVLAVRHDSAKGNSRVDNKQSSSAASAVVPLKSMSERANAILQSINSRGNSKNEGSTASFNDTTRGGSSGNLNSI